jgi:hypothetical protein
MRRPSFSSETSSFWCGKSKPSKERRYVSYILRSVHPSSSIFLCGNCLQPSTTSLERSNAVSAVFFLKEFKKKLLKINFLNIF